LRPPFLRTGASSDDERNLALKAALRDRYGPPSVVEVREVERPRPVDDEVLVRVHAASVNRADLDQLYPSWQFYRLIAGLRRPRSPRVGLDVAGVVVEIGPGVTRFKPGDRVFGDLYAFGAGSFAEYVSAPQRAFATMPAAATFEDAATLPHSALLALQALRHGSREVAAGERVLIDGASGNVGPFAVQIAKARGATVTGVASKGKLDFVTSLGADRVIDYAAVDYTTEGERYDWILDVNSHHAALDVRRCLRPDGVYWTLGGTTVDIFTNMLVGAVITAASRRTMGLMLGWRPFNAAPQHVESLKALYSSGVIRPSIDRRYPLEEVVDALRRVDQGHARGKVVITMDHAAIGVPSSPGQA